ncbi:MAG: MFS transporter [Bacteroidales bacterium]|nr:MFS transporter [Bacteroidales bacterium]
MSEQAEHLQSSMKCMKVFYPLMVLAGFVQLLIPSTIHIIMDHFHLSEGEVGQLPLIYFIGIMLSAILITQLIQKFSVKTLIVSSALLVSVSLVAASLSQWFVLLTFFCFFAGLGNGILIILPGVYATNVLSKESARIQSVLFGFLSFGFIVGPLFPGLIENLDISWRWAIAAPGVFILPFVIPIIITRLEHIEKAERLSFRIIKDIISFDRRFFLGMIVALILAGGAAVGFVTWIITFLEKERGMLQGSAHLVLCGIGVTIVLGRMACGYLARRFSSYKILIIITIVSAVMIFFAPLPKVAMVNMVLFWVASLFFSGIYPLLLSAAIVYPKTESSSAYTLFFIAISVGGLSIPYVLGQIFEHVGAVAGMSSIAILFLGVLVCLFIIKRELPVCEHTHHKPFPN